MIDLSLLRRTPPKEHRVDTGDVLGVYIEGILGGQDRVPPVNFRQNSNSYSSLGYPIRVRADGTISLPGIEPINVRGMTIGDVERAVRRSYTTGEKPPLKKGAERIIVNLQRPRHYRVLVIRQEVGNTNTPSGNDGQLSSNTQYNYSNNTGKFGMGRTVNLPVYKNDVLHALAETGGLPGLDAENVIYVIRRRGDVPCEVVPAPAVAPHDTDSEPRPDPSQKVRNFSNSDAKKQRSGRSGPELKLSRDASRRRRLVRPSPSPVRPTGNRRTIPRRSRVRNFDPLPESVHSGGWNALIRGQSPGRGRPSSGGNGVVGRLPSRFSQHLGDGTINSPHVVRIPLRVFPGQRPAFTEEDITLQDGDVVLIERRDCDVFYSGGLLGGGRFRLPRDRDLDVLEALAMVQSRQVAVLPTRAIGGVAATNQDVTAGASDLIVLRRRPRGGQLAIRINLYDAVRDPRQRINVRPGDHLILQYTRKEAIAAFFERHILDGVVLGVSSGLFFNN